MAFSATKRAVTWTFDDDTDLSSFASGDLVAFGPVTITSITPGSTVVGTYTKNGTMVDPPVNVRQGYDSRQGSYISADNVDPANTGQPLVVTSGRVVTTESRDKATTSDRPQTNQCEILTVVPTPAGGGAPLDLSDYFRPAYVGGIDSLPTYLTSDMIPVESDLDLATLTLAPGSPAWPFGAASLVDALDEASSRLERPWLDHVNGWTGREFHPDLAMPDYGRDMSSLLGIAMVLLVGSSDVDGPTTTARATLRIRLAQIGLDFFGILKAGGLWQANGGHASGRLGPVLLAGHLFNDPEMLGVCANDGKWRFGEIAQTFVISAADLLVERPPGSRQFREDEIGDPWWGFRHYYRETQTAAGWFTDSYQTCCTATAWFGQALALMLLRRDKEVNHNVWFDYLDRYKNEGWPLIDADPTKSASYKVWDEWMRAVITAAWDDVYATVRRPAQQQVKLTDYGSERLLRFINGEPLEPLDLEFDDDVDPPLRFFLAYLRLDADPADDPVVNASKEIRTPGADGYTRVELDFTFSNGELTLTTAVRTGAFTAAAGVPKAFWITDAPTGGKAWFYGSSKVLESIGPGTSLSVDAGALRISLG